MQSRAKVLLCTSLAVGKEYCVPLLRDALARPSRLERLEGVDHAHILFDEIALEAVVSSLHMIRCDPTRRTGLILPGVPESCTIHGRLARNREAQRQFFLQGDWTHLYWHDSDMVPPAAIIPRLLARDVDVTSGVYAMRGHTAANLPMLTKPYDPANPTEVGDVAELEMDAEEGCVYPLGFGMGCMLVSREAMERTPFRAPEDYYPGGPSEYGEDLQWCLDFTAWSGRRPQVDMTIPVWHVDHDGRANRPSTEVIA